MKFKRTTRGIPNNFSYVIIEKDGIKLEIRHNQRVQSAYSNDNDDNDTKAVFTLDVALIPNGIINDEFGENKAVANKYLISFGEAKHLPAYSELIASYFGMVHELTPQFVNLQNESADSEENNETIETIETIYPSLFVSGYIQPSAEGVIDTMNNRNFKINFLAFSNKDVKELTDLEIKYRNVEILLPEIINEIETVIVSN